MWAQIQEFQKFEFLHTIPSGLNGLLGFPCSSGKYVNFGNSTRVFRKKGSTWQAE